MAKKQLQIAGTEPKTDDEIEDAASIYRGHMLSRMEFGKKEKQAKDELLSIVHRKIESGMIKLPPEALEGKVVTVYRFADDEGEELELKYGKKEQVRVRKAKDGDEDEELLE